MKINVKGAIIQNGDKWIYNLFEMDSVCPNDVNSSIEAAKGEKLDVYINSGGGNIFAGNEIYSALREYQGQVNIHVVGIAGSAASVIACAGHSDITPTGQFMIHNVAAGAQGDFNVMESTKEVLISANRAISAAYQLKTGKSEAELLGMMNHGASNIGTWLTAQEAVDQHFIDGIAENQNVQLTATIGCDIIPQSVINKIRAQYKNPQAKRQADFLQAELNLLKVKVI